MYIYVIHVKVLKVNLKFKFKLGVIYSKVKNCSKNKINKINWKKEISSNDRFYEQKWLII